MATMENTMENVFSYTFLQCVDGRNMSKKPGDAIEQLRKSLIDPAIRYKQYNDYCDYYYNVLLRPKNFGKGRPVHHRGLQDRFKLTKWNP